MVLFTRGDFLKKKTIEECLGKPRSVIRNLTEACGNRYHVFNNNQTGDRTQVTDLLEKIDAMLKENGASYYSCKMFREMEREKQELQMKILMDRVREREEEMKKLEEEKERLKMMMEEEQHNQDKERKRREEELKREIRKQEKHQRETRDEMRRERETFRREIEQIRQEKEKLQIRYDTEIEILMNRIENERKKIEEEYKTLIKDKEEKEREISEMKKEREELEKQNLEEKMRKEEKEKRREREKQICDEQIQRLQSEMEGIIREKERIERERREQLEDSEKRLKEERKMREDQRKTLEEKLRLLEEQHEEELKRRRVQWREGYEREKEKMMRKICSQTDPSLQVTAYRKLETEYSKWSWSLRSAMMETENKLHNQIENDVIHEIEETDLHRELRKTSEEVNKSMSEFFEKDGDEDMLIQWKTSFEIKIKDVQENIVRETKRRLNEVLQQRDLKKKIDAQRTHHENTLYEKSKELALKLKDKAVDEETLKKEFDLFWEQSVNMIIRDTPPIKDIDIMRDVREIHSDVYENAPVDHWRERRDIFTVLRYDEYVQFKKSSRFTKPSMFRTLKEWFGYILSKEDEVQIRSLVTDVAQQTDRMIQSFNISMIGYNISCIQQLTHYIRNEFL